MKEITIEMIEHYYGLTFIVEGEVVNMDFEDIYTLVELLESRNYIVTINNYYD